VIAREAGVDDFLAEAKPKDKMDLIKREQSKGKLVAMAGPYGIDIVLESCPVLTIQTVAQALEIIAAINQPHFGLLVDTLHVSRSGEVDLLKAIDPGLIRYVQLCDAPLAQPANAAAYMDQALYERMLPGDGELPLLDILALVQDDVIVSAEIPLRQHLARGVPHVEIARQAIQRSKEIMGAARSLHGIG